MMCVYFFILFFITLLLTLFFIKFNTRWAKWIPAIMSFLATIIMGLKILFFPAPEMAVLGEVVYAMIFATITLASTIGGVIIFFWKRKKAK